MRKRDGGYTLTELLVVVVIFGFVMAGTTQMFSSVMNTYRQQGRITETNIEGVIGLELLRQDVGKAGYGLPWSGLPAYAESGSNPYGLNAASGTVPPALSMANDVAAGAAVADTDYLVVRATSVATNNASSKWTFLEPVTGATTTWTPASENLAAADRVIVISPGVLTSSAARNLVSAGTQFSAVGGFADATETRIVYGVDPDSDLKRPFNRADFFINIPDDGAPPRCAGGTGVLTKAVVNHTDAAGFQYLPLMDCVADMQVIFRLDRDGDGQIDFGGTNELTDLSSAALTAEQIRTQVKEVRIYVLAQEGQYDRSYTHTTNPVAVGSDPVVGASLGRIFNFAAAGIANWQNYRWKVYTLVIKLVSIG